jgi:ELWxxDGT repeat protein/VCBS repeat-containing protein
MKHLTAVGSTLFFSADDGTSGPELWKSNGTSAGTVRVKDIRPGASGADPSYLTPVGSTLFFSADDGASGLELWKTDGTAAGTVLVKDILPGAVSSYPRHLTAVGDLLYFVAGDLSGGGALWVSDGTAEGTQPVPAYQSVAPHSVRNLTVVDGRLYYSASTDENGDDLWKLIPGASISGKSTGAVTEDGTLTTGGTLTVSGGPGENKFQTPSAQSLVGTYGTFAFNANSGVWQYTLNNNADIVQALRGTQQVSDRLTVTSHDGTATREIVVAINGKNDPATITGKSTGSVSEDGVLATGGTLTVSDVDAGQQKFQSVVGSGNNLGTFTFNKTTGVWKYTLANSTAVVQALKAGQQETLTLSVSSLDGTATRQFIIKIDGRNDAPVLDASVAPALTAINEDVLNSNGTPIRSLIAGITDVDGGAMRGIAATAAQTAHGRWEFFNGSEWKALGAVKGTAARLLPVSTEAGDWRVRFIPNANFHGTASLTYFAWDRTQGVAGGVFDISTSERRGGATAFSTTGRSS